MSVDHTKQNKQTLKLVKWYLQVHCFPMLTIPQCVRSRQFISTDIATIEFSGR